MPKNIKRGSENRSFADKLQSEVKGNKSYINLVLGLLIVFVAGILVLNYFKKNQDNLGPAQQVATEENQGDVQPDKLPGKYTVKEGDTLYLIAEKYYQDGYKFPKLAEANKLNDVNTLEVGQVLDIPKLEKTTLATTETTEIKDSGTGTGGAVNQTVWGETISGDSYTVVEGDWLSKIAGRAYGDIMAFDKIAKANNIANPDVIEPGTVLKIPR
ncbi:MAG: hypothetical protein UU73_C0001G0058 [Candidatus Daviesbacteria bacterium GW2011_GWA1_41_61]|uniref:LysM domain-containing protein n=1 Tax=Candidatus Daviesbacteria bacterium GW2011_GWA2_40_9 TaxID=1618424 RepID=A0A0G0WF77_9BACT|nr:MAG: hypothetical protein UU29_C0008G0059 [Candidatus Daviesbacteria bacterium GW2011_GWA2_40_9]KKR92877.1 MAG: hypothetical protein UU44_C0004G0059 [Candidatus Daviesbacteria bacterium GW2011_GWB1_41_15]KKS15421.1 MAG: hypothetical protein UU73_C0001G0058 [Candidatus Daviesbacteria bacterium GW2011_GWA1_41_61]